MKTYKDDNKNFKPMNINKNSNTKEKTMKLLLTLSLASLLFFIGCDQSSEPTSPAGSSTTPKVNLISIPAPASGMSVEALLTKYKEIEGDEGGRFTAYFSYEGGPFGNVTVYSKLYFYDDAFSGDKVISQTLDTDYAAMSFGPSMQFDARVKLDLKFTGLDLTGVDPNNVDFVYVDDDGTVEYLQYDYITVNLSTGTIEVDDAELTHFSRYGFVNGQE
jgi:hypothetical protein